MRRSAAKLVLVLLLGVGLGCAQVLQHIEGAAQGAVSAVVSDPGAVKEKVEEVTEKVFEFTRDLTPEQEHYLGRSVTARILGQYGNRYRDMSAIEKARLEGITAYVSQVGALVAAAAIEQADRPRVPYSGWHFVVVDDPEIAAFAAPAGFVVVTTGAVESAQTEDELACLLAHEVAHVVHGHGLTAVKKARFAGAIGGLMTKATSKLTDTEVGELAAAFNDTVGDITESLFTKGYEKGTEFEADLLGAKAAAAAGYDPYAMVAFLRTAHRSQKVKSQGHPEFSDRITRLQKRYSSPAVASNERAARFTSAKNLL